jgi:hypothetical protein
MDPLPLVRESRVFTRQARALSADEYSALVWTVATNPDRGAVIRGAHGLRKMRVALEKIGKRGGLRIIYKWYRDMGVVYLLFLYPKAEQADLTPDQLKVLLRTLRNE